MKYSRLKKVTITSILLLFSKPPAIIGLEFKTILTAPHNNTNLWHVTEGNVVQTINPVEAQINYFLLQYNDLDLHVNTNNKTFNIYTNINNILKSYT